MLGSRCYHPSTVDKSEEEATSAGGNFVTQGEHKWTNFVSCDFAIEICGWGSVAVYGCM